MRQGRCLREGAGCVRESGKCSLLRGEKACLFALRVVPDHGLGSAVGAPNAAPKIRPTSACRSPESGFRTLAIHWGPA